MPKVFFVFDVETIGLYGEQWAVGWVCLAKDPDVQDAKVLFEGYAACPMDAAKGTDEDRRWVEENCPQIAPTCSTPLEVRNAFWEAWMSAKALGATAWADCAYPVESSLFRDCVMDDRAARTWEAPYPLHEIATVFEMAGMDATSTNERLEDEPQHHPLGDARQSARLLMSAL